MSGIRIKPGVDDNFYVSYVRSGCSAELASIKKGDQIVAINGEELTLSNLNDLLGHFSKKANSTISLTLLRNEGEVVIDFRLERII